MYVPEMSVCWDDDEMWSKVCHAGGLDSFEIVHSTVEEPTIECTVSTVKYVREERVYGRMTTYHWWKGEYSFLYEWQAEW